MKFEKKYSLRLISPSGAVRIIVESEPSVKRVRAITFGIKKRPGQKLVISLNGKDLPGGANALDQIAYEAWLISHNPEVSGDSLCSVNKE